jgi:hypothetical protein
MKVFNIIISIVLFVFGAMIVNLSSQNIELKTQIGELKHQNTEVLATIQLEVNSLKMKVTDLQDLSTQIISNQDDLSSDQSKLKTVVRKHDNQLKKQQAVQTQLVKESETRIIVLKEKTMWQAMKDWWNS